MSDISKVRQAIMVLSEITGKRISELGAASFERLLQGYTEEEILSGITRCGKELPRFPTVADVIARIDDGHPGAEEAWALIPRNESDSAVWTDEIRAAYFSGANRLVDEDPIAARMAFKETYTRILSEARMRKKKAQWMLTLGHDSMGRKAAAQLAVDRGYLPVDAVSHLLIDRRPNSDLLALVGKIVSPQKAIEFKDTARRQTPASEIRSQLETFVGKLRDQHARTNSV